MFRTVLSAVILFLLLSCARQWDDGFVTKKIPGEANRFDPVSTYEDVLSLAGDDANLISIVAFDVNRDGTINLTEEGGAQVNYIFIRYINQDILAELTGDARFEIYNAEEIHLTAARPGQVTSTLKGVSVTRKHKGLYLTRRIYRETHDRLVVEPPENSFAEIWKRAANDADIRSDRAIIKYDHQGYNLWIAGTNIHQQYSNVDF
jgi:hypothetical protein